MIVILFGPHGSGKGTQAKMIADEYGLVRISTGDVFRESIASGSELGKKVKKFVEGNVYVPDDLVNEVVKEKIVSSDKNFVFDGYPRTMDQTKFLEKVFQELKLQVDIVINIDVDDAELVKRLENRRICSKCGATYNLATNSPAKDEMCDVCGGKLYQRKDDTKEGIKSRMNEYKTKAQPLLEHFRKHDKLADIDGNKPPELVFTDIKQLLDKFV
ncbi:adenylate kinase [archaeon]|nr:MAG: adenylate kinase [archaeon]